MAPAFLAAEAPLEMLTRPDGPPLAAPDCIATPFAAEMMLTTPLADAVGLPPPLLSIKAPPAAPPLPPALILTAELSVPFSLLLVPTVTLPPAEAVTWTAPPEQPPEPAATKVPPPTLPVPAATKTLPPLNDDAPADTVQQELAAL
jgi:hypothetical protein